MFVAHDTVWYVNHSQAVIKAMAGVLLKCKFMKEEVLQIFSECLEDKAIVVREKVIDEIALLCMDAPEFLTGENFFVFFISDIL